MSEPGQVLSDNVKDLLRLLTKGLGDDGELLLTQVDRSVVTAYSPTMIDVVVPHTGSRLSFSDGPLPVRALVYQEEELAGEILVWVREGWFIGVEQAWYTADPPRRWPTPSQIRFFGEE